jgi:Flp pilus assembly protein TadG
MRGRLKTMRHLGRGVAPGRAVTSPVKEAGTALVEYAFVFVFFMALVLGIMDFSRALYAYHFVSNAARDATRWAAVNGSTCAADGSCAAPASLADIQGYVASRVPMGIDASQITANATWPTGTVCISQAPPTPAGCTPAACFTTANAPGCTVEVQVNYQFSFLFPLVHISPITISSSSEMVIAH